MIVRYLLQTVVLAASQMWANKVRSLLTTLGIVIGVWAITTVIAAVGGLNEFVLSEFEQFGARKLELWGNVPAEDRGGRSWDDVMIDRSDAAALRRHADAIELISLQANMRMDARFRDEIQQGVQVMAIEPDWLEIQGRNLLAGRPLTIADDEGRLQVCLINDFAVEELLLPGDGVGQTIYVDDRRFLVVGVLETQQISAMFGGGESRSEIFIPLSTGAQLRSSPWTSAVVLMQEAKLADEVREQIRFVLRQHRRIEAGEPDTFEMFIYEEVLGRMRIMAASLTGGASVLVGISLLVGGIGIMNIMLVSVSERTREIGLRKALGASPLIILTQFLIEAVTLCVFGGLVGLVLGQLTTIAIGNFDFLKAAEIPLWAIILAFGFSAGVGIVFGMWPATKAARLDPIDALRHE